MRRYIALMKPRIIELLLVATLPTLVLAERGWPGLKVSLATVLGGALAAGSANAFNSIIDRDIDAQMERTAHRPMAQGLIKTHTAFLFATIVGIISVTGMAIFTNALAAGLTFLAILMYVLGYTLILKRRTAENIVWGGAAGCMPVLIAWAAIKGSLSWTPIILFLIIFFWTPPHYWPLAIKYREDYAKASVPMLPVVSTIDHVAIRIIRYSYGMVFCSLLLIPIAKLGSIYIIVSIVLGALFIFEAHRILDRVKKNVEVNAMRLFHGSISYLSILFLAMAIDILVF
jgi:protoheme IX farnesyltransferase